MSSLEDIEKILQKHKEYLKKQFNVKEMDFYIFEKMS